MKAVSLLWLGSLLGAGCAFLTQVILARQLGPSNFGIFAAALATITLLTPLAGFGVSGYWLKAFGKEGWQAIRWLPGSFRFATLSTFIVVLCLVGWAILGPHDDLTTTVLLLLTFYVFGQLVVGLVSSKYQLEERYLSLAIWQFAPHFLRLFLVAALVYATTFVPNVKFVAYAYAMVSLVFFTVGSVFLFRMYQGAFFLQGHGVVDAVKKQNKYDFPGTFQVAIQSLPFGLVGILYLIYFQSNLILLNYLSGPESAGIYNVAFVVMAAVYLLPSVIYQKYLLPKLHRWAIHDHARFYQVYRLGNLAMLGAGSVAMIMLWLIMPWGVPFLFGDEYARSVEVIMILALCAPVRYLSSSAGAFLATKDHMKNKAYILAFAAIFNIILNVFLIHLYGYIGAAISTLITEVVVIVMIHYYVRKYIF